jgi:glycine/D-amino acid oxidase-like deaminating enzyme
MTPSGLPPTRATRYGTNRAASVPALDKIPTATDVVVIGAGASGLFTAWNLAKWGINVTVCEKGEVGAEASSRAFGWISGLLLDPCKLELSQQSLELWNEAQSEFGELGFRSNGLCFLAESEEELGYFESWRDQARSSRYRDIEVLAPEGVTQLLRHSTRQWTGAIWARSDGSVEPKLLPAVVAEGARRRGVKIIQNCAVRGLDLAGGRIAGVVTEHGRIQAQRVVFAGNVWSRLFCGNLGVNVPQLYVLMSMGCTHPLADGPTCSGGQEHWAWRRQIDGAYSLGRLRGQRLPVTRDCIQLFSKFLPALKAEARNVHLSFGKEARRDLFWPRTWSLDQPSVFERIRIFDPVADERPSERSLQLNAVNSRAFRGAAIAETWAGAVTLTPDNLPIAGAVEQIPGLYLLTGCSYGLTWAPVLGRMIADLISNQAPTIDPSPYRLNRFFDGTPIIPRT